MSETPSSPEPATRPVVTPSTQTTTPVVEREPRRDNRLTTVAAWVGIVAGVVFVVAVIFFSGFVLGKASDGGHRGGHGHGDKDRVMIHRGGPGFMGPGGADRPGPAFGPGGPGFERPEQPPTPPSPTTTAPARP